MIQFYNDIQKTIIKINSYLSKNPAQIQKIYSTGRYISFQIRFPGKTIVVYLGRGGGYEGLWLSESQPCSELRIRDRFLEFLRSKMTSVLLNKIELDEQDRIINFELIYTGKKNNALFFYRGRELLFIFKDENFIFKSWENKKSTVVGNENLFEIFNDEGRKNIEKNKLGNEKDIKELLDEELNDTKSTKKNKKNDLIVDKIKKDLEKLEGGNKILDKLKGENKEWIRSLPNKSIISGIKFNFQSPELYKRIDTIYERIKNIKKSKEILEKRLEVLSKKNQTESFNVKVVNPPWGVKKNVQVPKNQEKEYIKFENDKMTVYVGKNSIGNDYLRNQLSNKEDWWMHLENLSSAHALIKLKKPNLEIEDIQVVASVVAEYSHFNSSKIPVIYTQYKNIKAIKGTPGAVTFKKEKHLLVDNISDWRSLFSNSI